MKLFVAFYVLGSVAVSQAVPLTPELSAILKESYKVCLENSHVDKALVAKARIGDFAEDENLDVFFTCIFKRSDLLDGEGKLNKEVILTKMSSDTSSENVEKLRVACFDVRDQPKEKIAKLAYKCYLKEALGKIPVVDALLME